MFLIVGYMREDTTDMTADLCLMAIRGSKLRMTTSGNVTVLKRRVQGISHFQE